MMRCYFFASFLLILGIIGCETDPSLDQPCDLVEIQRVAFYNVENLFDGTDDPDNNEGSFLPTNSRLPWTDSVYLDKLSNIAEVINDMFLNTPALMVGLCEVENENVVNRLAGELYTFQDAQYIHQQSPDERGIDCALIYDAAYFQPLDKEFIELNYPFDPGDRTRHIVYVKGITCGDDTLHVFVNHWKSRSGGEVSVEKRNFAAQRVKDKIQKIQETASIDAKIIVMGDFNDEYYNESMSQVLVAKTELGKTGPGELYNTHAPIAKGGEEGTLSFSCRWNTFDMIVTSKSVAEGDGWILSDSTGEIFKKNWMLYYSQNCSDSLPSRYSSGSTIFGGFSDHLPVYVDLKKQ